MIVKLLYEPPKLKVFEFRIERGYEASLQISYGSIDPIDEYLINTEDITVYEENSTWF